jgi:hypothetical protein
MSTKWTTEQIAWAAGFFDGEGCITAKSTYTSSRGRKRVLVGSLVVTVVQRVVDPLYIFREMFGGAVRLNKNRTGNPVWAIEYYGTDAMNILEALRPYLVVKREQAELALTMKDSFHTGGRQLTDDEIKRRQVWHAQMRQLKAPKAGVRPVTFYEPAHKNKQIPLIGVD